MSELRYYIQIGKTLHGGMGQVYHLRHKLWDIDMAMKQPLPDHMRNARDKQRFYAECQRWIQLGIHPNLVQCFFVYQVDGIPCAFSEWVGNGSLRQHIDGPLYAGGGYAALSRILDVAIQAAMGLQYSHRNGVLHLDVKPDNILLDKDGSAKITDFGISTMLNEKVSKAGFTPLYCAPEQKAGGTLGRYTDIYCWAVTVLHMLVKKANWINGLAAGYEYEYYVQQAQVTVPPVLRALLGRCLQEDPMDRPQDFDGILDELMLLWRSIFHQEYPRQYYGINTIPWDAMNNRAISLWELGHPSQAKALWQQVNRESLGHVQSSYNELLYDWRFGKNAQTSFCVHTDDAELKFTREKNKSRIRGEGYLHYLESRWAFSTGAYALACQYADLAVQRSPQDQVILDNQKMVRDHCAKQGPVLVKELALSKHLALQGKLAYLGFLPNGNLIAVSPDGRMELFDINGSVLRRAKTKLTGINLTAVSQNGRYLALGRATKTKTDGGYPWEIRVIDLQSMSGPLKLSGSSSPLRLISLLDAPGGTCQVVAKFASETLNWDVPTVMQSWVEGQGLKSRSREKLHKDLFGAVTLVSAGKDNYMGLSSHECVVWGNANLQVCHRKQLYGIDLCPRLNLTPVPGKPYAIHGGVRGGYEVVDYVSMQVVTREVLQSITGAPRRYADHLSVSADGKTLALCWGDTLQLWTLPDYTDLPEPLWAVCRFRDSDLSFQQKREYDNALSALLSDLTALEKKGAQPPEGSVKARMVQNMGIIKEYCWNVEDYLALSARASRFLSVTDLDVSRRLTVNTLAGISCQLVPPPGGKTRFEVFTKDGAFSAVQSGHQIKLLRSADKAVLETLNVGNSSAMGFSSDRRYLVRELSGKTSGYELFLLEWLFEETPVEG